LAYRAGDRPGSSPPYVRVMHFLYKFGVKGGGGRESERASERARERPPTTYTDSVRRTVRVVDRVHRHSTSFRPEANPVVEFYRWRYYTSVVHISLVLECVDNLGSKNFL